MSFSHSLHEDTVCFETRLELILMKNQALFSSKDKSKKLKCHLLQFLFGTWLIFFCLIIILLSDNNWLHGRPTLGLSCSKHS